MAGSLILSSTKCPWPEVTGMDSRSLTFSWIPSTPRRSNSWRGLWGAMWDEVDFNSSSSKYLPHIENIPFFSCFSHFISFKPHNYPMNIYYSCHLKMRILRFGVGETTWQWFPRPANGRVSTQIEVSVTAQTLFCLLGCTAPQFEHPGPGWPNKDSYCRKFFKINKKRNACRLRKALLQLKKNTQKTTPIDFKTNT